MIDISVKDLVKSFEIGNHLLDGLSFDINEGERVGIMGRNGCGKTTLFRILTGEISPDEGTVMIAPGKKLGLISQIPRYPAGYTVEQVLRENLPLPFPLRESESELFDGSLIERELGLVYTPFRDGMQKTWNAFAPVFEQTAK